MSSSTQDICFTVVHQGAALHYSTVKACASLLWDVRFGIFGKQELDFEPSLDFVFDDEDWDGCIEHLDEPLANPTYGTVLVDFDRKLIVDANRYGRLDSMFFAWLQTSLESVAAGDDDDCDGLIPKSTLEVLLAEGRLSITCDIPEPDRVPDLVLPSTIGAANTVASSLQPAGRWAKVSLPDGWRIECVST
jgi:hypothetical protein